MIEVDGIILIISCHKHLDTRLKLLRLPKDDYGKWKVIYVIGDLFLDCDYKLEGNFMTIKCEDSYIHLLKKLVLSLKYLYKIFNIKEGVLRCGDDLIFNEKLLEEFLESSKKRKIYDDKDIFEDIDFLGMSASGKSFLSHKISDYNSKITVNNNFMVEYYIDHPEDFDNPLHNLKGVDISKYTKCPHFSVAPCGVLIYFSNKSCKILINHMNNINYNIFHYDEYTNSYPYTIEDCAIPYILYSNKISFIHSNNMCSNNPNDTNFVIAIHTNMNR
jgi:hypothetical protein